jgi:HEAT repeat protein
MPSRTRWVLLALCLLALPGTHTTAAAQSADAMVLALRLKDPDEKVRLDAATKLAALGPRAAPAIPQLSDALVDSVASVRHAVLNAFGAMGPRAADAAGTIAILLGHEEMETQLLTADALARIGNPAPCVGPLNRALEDDNAEVRVKCAQVLGGFGAASLAAVPRLVRLASADTSEAVRAAAKDALPRIAPAQGRAQRVAAGLRSKDKATRLATATSMSEMGDEGRPAIPTLLRAFHDPDAEVRFAAAASAAAIAPDSASVKKSVVVMVTDPKEDRFARTRLARAAQDANLPLADGVPALAEQAKSTDLLLRKGAVVILGLVRPVSDPAIQALIMALGDASPDVRGLSAESLGEIGKPAQAALPSLDHLMKTDRDAGVRNFASAAYYRISP